MLEEYSINRWGTHLGLLFRALQVTKGTVLEMGAGTCSTPVLHALCTGTVPQRKLITLEEDPTWFHKVHTFKNEFHDIRHVANWDRWYEQDLVKDIGVVLVDHGKWGDEQWGYDQRVEATKFYADRAEIIVVHDTDNGLFLKNAKWPDVIRSFKYIVTDLIGDSMTTAFSNWVDVRKVLQPMLEIVKSDLLAKKGAI